MKLKLMIIALLSAYVFSSCSSGYSLMKRRYTKGYYFDVSKKKEDVKAHSNHTATAKSGKQVQKPAVTEVEALQESVIASSKPLRANPITPVTEVASNSTVNRKTSESQKKGNHPFQRAKTKMVEYANNKVVSKVNASNNKVMVGQKNFPVWYNNTGSDGMMYLMFSVLGSLLITFLFLAILFASPEFFGGFFLVIGAAFLIGLVVVGILFLINAD